jgi:EAL domain-containing protein (putative c-di-GMP-specific phosphodiesterase class I)
VAEPFKVLSGESERDERWIPMANLLEIDIDLSPQCGCTRQLLDASFQLELALADALRMNALRVEFQPQFDLDTGRGCGVEALARWTRPTGESISPSVFIPLAERAGMIHALGAWILQSACATASAWCDRGVRPMILSVNVSALQIDEQFSAVIEGALKLSRLSANRLVLEITESALIANPALTIEHLKAWKQLGVRIALDDFGTGYSSLSYLTRLPVDRLKLDRALIHRMPIDRKSAAVMRSIIALGAELDMEVIAEGVETEVQLQMLKDLGCPQVQGFLLGRPMLAEQAQAVLNKPWGNRPMRLADRVGIAADNSPAHAF